MTLKIFYDSTTWRGFQAPEKPEYHGDSQIGKFEVQQYYKQAYTESKRNAMEIGNPEIIEESEQFSWDVYKIINDICDPMDYDWPGSAVIKDGKYILSI